MPVRAKVYTIRKKIAQMSSHTYLVNAVAQMDMTTKQNDKVYNKNGPSENTGNFKVM